MYESTDLDYEPSSLGEADPPPDNDLAEFRLKKIRELEMDAFDQFDPLDAALQAQLAGLLAVGCQVEQVLRPRLRKVMNAADDTDGMRDYLLLRPALDDLSKLTRQADRYAQLLRRPRTAGPVLVERKYAE